MAPVYQGYKRHFRLQEDDIEAIQSLYGQYLRFIKYSTKFGSVSDVLLKNCIVISVNEFVLLLLWVCCALRNLYRYALSVLWCADLRTVTWFVHLTFHVYPSQPSKEKYVTNIYYMALHSHWNLSSVWIVGPPQSKKNYNELPIPITITAQVGPSRISMPNMCKMKFDDITRLSDDRYYIFKQSWVYKLNRYHNTVSNKTIFYHIKSLHTTLFSYNYEATLYMFLKHNFH